MNIKPKSPEQLGFQVANFARTLPRDERLHVFKNLPEIARAEPADLDDEMSIPRHPSNPVETKLPIHLSYADYLTHLREVTAVDSEAESQRQLLVDYEYFSDDISRLTQSLPEEHVWAPNYLGRGAYSEAFVFEKNGKQFVARIPFDLNFKAATETVDSHMRAAVRGRGIPHLEQLLAVSYETGVTVSELMPGKPFTHLTIEEIKGIPNSHFVQLLETISEAVSAKIDIDVNDGNILYDSHDGFGIIDYTAASEQPNIFEAIEDMVQSLDYTYRPNRDIEYSVDDHQAALLLVMKLRESLRSKTSSVNEDLRMTAFNAADRGVNRELKLLTALDVELIALHSKKRTFNWLRSLVSMN